ncbi:MAG TPA: YitT family protein [Clostridiaceae bacterium]|jgi:uncharacterized membrane-anchored protein YitT (DUF2179 family)|nr:YitT family protein [Clostridiaceae bacterium]
MVLGNVKKYALEYIFIIIGAFLMAVSTALFLLPNQLSTGGISGISTILYYSCNYPVGLTMLLINVPLFVIAMVKVNKRLFFKSILGTVLLSVFIDLLENLSPITNDRFLACIYGGIIMGIGTAIILKAGASTGGTDLLSYVIRAYNNKFKSSRVIIIADTIIIFFNIIFFREIEIGLYSVIAIYLMGKMIDIIFEGIYFTKIMFIISEKYEEISKEIGILVKRGSTGIYSKGMYSGKQNVMLFCVASRKEVAEIKQIIKQIDKNAFIVTTDAIETLGKGFSE